MTQPAPIADDKLRLKLVKVRPYMARCGSMSESEGQIYCSRGQQRKKPRLLLTAMTHSDGFATLVALVTCRPQESPPSVRQPDRSPPGHPGGRRESGSIPPQRAEGVREVALFSTICHYLKWHVIVLCSQIHYASTESRGLIMEGGGQWWSGRAGEKVGVGPR